MANIRVYELASNLNMKTKALLEKLGELDISVRSHMSSLDERTVMEVKSHILGKSADALDGPKPKVIRRKRKKPAPKVEKVPETEADAAEPVSRDVSKEPAEAASAPEEKPAARKGESRVDETESVEATAPVEPDAETPAEHPETAEAKPEAEAAPEPPADAPADSADASAAESGLDETAEAAAPKTEAEAAPEPADQPTEPEATPSELDSSEPADAGPTADETMKTAAETATETETETTPETPAEPEKPATKEPAKGKKKKKKDKKDAPAKIIKLPTKPPPAAKKEPSAPAPADRAAAPRPANGAAAVTDKDAADKKKRKKGKKETGDGKETRWAKKKISFKGKEVVEGADLYAGGGRGRKMKKGAKGKQQQPQKTQITTPKAIKRRIKIDDTIVLSDLAKRMGIKANDIIMKLMAQGMMVTVNQTLDFETASLVAAEFAYGVDRAAFEEESVLKASGDRTDDPGKLESRPPVVTIMGHVDHGKTSLLDVIRKTRITDSEAGGITQHIGAYNVETSSGQIVFLDTPGHEAFTAMRARGAMVTDIVVLVVAADDGVMPQTIEAINHARAAEVPIIVAVNKIDKNNAEPERVLRELAEQGLVPEAWGGDTIVVNVSAKQQIGIDDLMEMILLQSEVLELKANPDRYAVGYVVEAKLDAGRGPVATVLIQEGTIHSGDPVVCGVHHGKVRAMLNDLGVQVESAGPSIPVEILGLSGVPNAGDELVGLEDDKSAKQVSDHRIQKQRSKELAKTSRLSLDKLFEQMRDGEVKELNLIIKADVHGSIEALRDSLTKLSNDEVAINVIHAATGTITESDISLAAVSNAIIIGFNVRPTAKVQGLATEEHVDIRYYNVIYNTIKDIQDAIVGMMESTYEERTLGRVEVREVFQVPKVGAIAGSYVTDGKIQRNALVRLLRDGIVVYEGKVGSLRRFKDDVKEVQSGYECGIGVDNYNDIKVGDILECYYLEEVKPAL